MPTQTRHLASFCCRSFGFKGQIKPVYNNPAKPLVAISEIAPERTKRLLRKEWSLFAIFAPSIGIRDEGRPLGVTTQLEIPNHIRIKRFKQYKVSFQQQGSKMVIYEENS